MASGSESYARKNNIRTQIKYLMQLFMNKDNIVLTPM